MVRHQSFIKTGVFCLLLVFVFQAPLRAENIARDLGLMQRGAGKGLRGAFALPLRVMQGATSSFPFGIVTGAIRGTFETVGWVVSGAFDAARGAAPYAKYAALI